LLRPEGGLHAGAPGSYGGNTTGRVMPWGPSSANEPACENANDRPTIADRTISDILLQAGIAVRLPPG
jgi:hypothetical protein